jgi:hypothetical protein
MNNVKSVKSLWLSIVSFLQAYVLTNEEEKGYMSHVSYDSRKFDICDEISQSFTCSWCYQYTHDKTK